MKRAWVYFAVSAVLFSSFAWAQSSDTVVKKPVPEDGTIINKTYANAYLGFSYPIPDGWKVSGDVASELYGKAHRFPSGGLELLILDRYTGSFRNRIVATALDATGLSATTSGFVSQIVRGSMDETGGEVVREPFAVTFAGQAFFRADYKQIFNGGTQSGTFVCTKLRGYFLGWMFVAGSPEELEGFVKSLQRLRSWKMSHVQLAGSAAPLPVHRNPTQGVRCGFASRKGSRQGLLVTKVRPQYPEVARQAGIQGTVVLKALSTQTETSRNSLWFRAIQCLSQLPLRRSSNGSTSPTCSMVRL